MELLFHRIDHLLKREITIHKPTQRIFDTSNDANGEPGGVYALPDYTKLTIQNNIDVLECYSSDCTMDTEQNECLALISPKKGKSLFNKWTLQKVEKEPPKEPFPLLATVTEPTPYELRCISHSLNFIKDVKKNLFTGDVMYIASMTSKVATRIYSAFYIVRDNYIIYSFEADNWLIHTYVVREDGAILILTKSGILYLLK